MTLSDTNNLEPRQSPYPHPSSCPSPCPSPHPSPYPPPYIRSDEYLIVDIGSQNTLRDTTTNANPTAKVDAGLNVFYRVTGSLLLLIILFIIISTILHDFGII